MFYSIAYLNTFKHNFVPKGEENVTNLSKTSFWGHPHLSKHSKNTVNKVFYCKNESMEDPSLEPQVNMYSRCVEFIRYIPLKVLPACKERHFYRWRWAHWRSLFTPDIFGPLLFQIVKGKRRGEMPLFMWKAHCTKSPAVQSRRERIWRRVFLNPRETSKAVLRGGQPRRHGGTPYKKKPPRRMNPLERHCRWCHRPTCEPTTLSLKNPVQMPSFVQLEQKQSFS